MIKINYWTSSHFEENIWDKYYCKSFASAKRGLKEIVKFWKERWKNDDIKEILDKYNEWVFDKKTCFSVWDCNISIWDLDIFIEEVILD